MADLARKSPLRNVSLDRSDPVPLHVQLKKALKDQILGGAWKTGDLLPAEPELCRDFGLSRTTVRQALAELAREGLVVRERGRGTFVAPAKLTERAVERLSGFFEDMVALGYPPVSRVLKQGVVPADEQVAARLNLRPGTRVVEIERLRLVQDEPVVLTTTYLPHKLCPGLETADLGHRSLYEYLQTECGLTLARGRRTIEAVAADARQAKLLHIRRGAPLVSIESVSFLPDGRPIEFYFALHRGDRSRFEVELVKGREGGEYDRTELGRLPPGGGSLRRTNRR